MKRPTIGITMGDPRGIGPEVIEKALRSREIRRLCRPIVFGDPEFFDWRRASQLSATTCGKVSAFYIRQAVQAALQRKIDAIVTGPIAKAHLWRAGIRYPGHTEYLAALTNSRKVAMMMAGPDLKVVLVTIHEPLARVPRLLSRRAILDAISLADRSLRTHFGIRRPRIAVAALNPHAGESALFGREEKKTIGPAIQAARRRKINASGPFSPDTVFWRAVRGEFDGVIAMYHDQGLIPLKLLHFDSAVNITLGLPIIRTSVDHGTAFEIAGRGVADPSSMIAAIRMAVAMVKKREDLALPVRARKLWGGTGGFRSPR